MRSHHSVFCRRRISIGIAKTKSPQGPASGIPCAAAAPASLVDVGFSSESLASGSHHISSPELPSQLSSSSINHKWVCLHHASMEPRLTSTQRRGPSRLVLDIIHILKLSFRRSYSLDSAFCFQSSSADVTSHFINYSWDSRCAHHRAKFYTLYFVFFLKREVS